MDRNKKLIVAAVRTLVLVLVVGLCSLFSKQVLYMGATMACMSAKSFLPQKGVSLGVDADETEVYEHSPKSEQAVTAVSQSTTAETTTAPAAAVSLSVTDTDSDIKKLMKQHESKQDEKGGGIKEKTYTTEGMTDSFGLVRMKNTNKTKVSIEQLLNTEADLTVNKKEPSVLIFHTHTTETFQISERDYYAADFAPRSESADVNMVRVGRAICEQIEKAGYKVIHDTQIHDGTYSGAYAHSRKSVEAYLEKYPSIKIVLDIHRDAIELSDKTKIKPVAQVGGKKAAQIMIISGCQEQGNGITNLPDWRYNLTFAVQLQNKLEENFSGITRPLYFCARSYNMNVTHNSLLVEIGSDSNTLEEAVYSGKCLGVAVSKLMDEYTEK